MIVFKLVLIILQLLLIVASIYVTIKLFNAKNAEEVLVCLLLLLGLLSPFLFK